MQYKSRFKRNWHVCQIWLGRIRIFNFQFLVTDFWLKSKKLPLWFKMEFFLLFGIWIWNKLMHPLLVNENSWCQIRTINFLKIASQLKRIENLSFKKVQVNSLFRNIGIDSQSKDVCQVGVQWKTQFSEAVYNFS